MKVGVLNLTLNVSAESGENIPLSKPPTPPMVPAENVRSGVKDRLREVLEGWELDELVTGPAVDVAEDD